MAGGEKVPMRGSGQANEGWAALEADCLGQRPHTPLIASLAEPIPHEVRATFDAAWEAAHADRVTGSDEVLAPPPRPSSPDGAPRAHTSARSD